MRRFAVLVFPVFMLVLSMVPTVFADTPYSWSITCTGEGNSTAAWYWYQNGSGGTFLTGGETNCNSTSSSSGTCPNQLVCSQGRPSNADTIIATLNVNCGYSYSGSVIKSFAPGASVSLKLTVTIKHGSCNGTYSKGSESTTFSLSA